MIGGASQEANFADVVATQSPKFDLSVPFCSHVASTLSQDTHVGFMRGSRRNHARLRAPQACPRRKSCLFSVEPGNEPR